MSPAPKVGNVGIAPEAMGFSAVADAYEQGRPGYPPEAVAHLRKALGIGPGQVLLDLAAGTGKLTRLLTPTGATVVAVEPVPEMRAQLRRKVPEAIVVAGTAEAIPLVGGRVDAVTVAQAFHWFRGEEAVPELRRVLKPGGALALVWNVRDTTRPLPRALEKILVRYRGASPSQASGAWREGLEATRLFPPFVVESFPFQQVVTRAQLVARVVSTSFIGCLPPAERQRLAEEVAALAPADEGIALHYRTDVYWCTSAAGGQV